MNEAEMNKLLDELNECEEGRRGWVSLTKTRAAKIGVEHKWIVGCAKVLGLVVERNGRNGWTAIRPKVQASA